MVKRATGLNACVHIHTHIYTYILHKITQAPWRLVVAQRHACAFLSAYVSFANGRSLSRRAGRTYTQ